MAGGLPCPQPSWYSASSLTAPPSRPASHMPQLSTRQSTCTDSIYCKPCILACRTTSRGNGANGSKWGISLRCPQSPYLTTYTKEPSKKRQRRPIPPTVRRTNPPALPRDHQLRPVRRPDPGGMASRSAQIRRQPSLRTQVDRDLLAQLRL